MVRRITTQLDGKNVACHTVTDLRITSSRVPMRNSAKSIEKSFRYSYTENQEKHSKIDLRREFSLIKS